MKSLIVAFGCAACGFTPKLASDATPSDDTQTSDHCFGSGLVKVCVVDLPTGEYNPSTSDVLDTDSATYCTQVMTQINGLDLCVKIERTILIDHHLTWSGHRPLVLVGTDTITVSLVGALDASSLRGVSDGPGANDGCAAAASGLEKMNGPAGGGGGAGGSFGTVGGQGGDGNGNGATGGAPAATVQTATVMGGCAGGGGGKDGSHLGGAPASGGGAVYLIAGNAIAIAGSVRANGASANGGDVDAGGGGGGAGGMIGLDAPVITGGGVVFANGGAGGEGGGGGMPGGAGIESDVPSVPARGGSGNPSGANGGDGSALNNPGQPGSNNGSGGGGGGGGGGIIRIFASSMSLTTISPSPAPN